MFWLSQLVASSDDSAFPAQSAHAKGMGYCPRADPRAASTTASHARDDNV
jgi:hypothetical protein